ncbi:hypothetical protein DICPUDRAFT_148187 [Dictyostelium purpureum]|uniref:Phospholipase B-like n=1 Tax=Dictyostelium purpureum TaxID=5786 RepID=F0ZAH1_DICPU|nr:uncharacterized protein DICPUDRAFT_148187 [Dictyostelium purpureum]EGC39069.1 hypothetical protein DICPUDRAFT_148187 [Dictyostelium purpureum]|eukprot:XP_003284419.1 hypothetical protein DICPUDRAFT_148187 [Dictyostelium purpureum]
MKFVILSILILFVTISFGIDQSTFNNFEDGSSSSSSSSSTKKYYSLTSNFDVVPGKQVPNSIAWGYFQDDLYQDGWGKLSIDTVSTVSDDIAFKAAGYLEGYLTWNYIYNFSVNYFNTYFNTSNIKEFPLEVIDFVSTNWEYMEEQIASASTTDPYWIQVKNSMTQQLGLFEGYNAAAGSDYQKTFLEIYMINLYGDLGDIVTATTQNNTHFSPMNQKNVEEYMATTGHCTTLIKLTANNSELYVAHTTWSEYADMIRIYKRINIPVASTPYGSETLFASYPGLLVSIDDFYMIRPSKLQLTETLNSILNQTLYTLIKPQTFLYWVRNLVANRLSNNGFDWVKYFVINNSGTNNIQFMIVDYKLFTPYAPLVPDTLWIVEQYPMGYVAADVTFNLIQDGYWASFNRPYFLEVFDVLGYPYYVTQYGKLFTYENNPRANIFRAQQGSIETVKDMQNMIEYNEWKTDPFSEGYPGNAIAARYDLKGGPDYIPSWWYRGAHGGIDAKLMSNAMFNSYTAMARNGPTVTDDCPPFNWADWDSIPHQGMPQIFNFSWITIDLN